MLEYIGNCVLDCVNLVKTTINKLIEVKVNRSKSSAELKASLAKTARNRNIMLEKRKADKLLEEAKLRLEAHKASEIKRASLASTHISESTRQAYNERRELKHLIEIHDHRELEFYQYEGSVGYKGKKYRLSKLRGR